ncbi:MAG: heme ABC exporter ATP-binding protein CcmA [Casimicrobiaceae bacterium]|nr:heme ABC exporter ATP-binding protein CcmA [Casimicrobiaceae bacterium]MCX8097450.1 heme ABC exporter ATP-binding protein CcmA [Casimicrobiaceae bacterium]MDW8311168.1 heme ABC exporter ATP-binding protein CcmA [Burkholderiales bacterium]
MSVLLRVEALAAERGGRRIFSELSFTAAAGQLVRIAGDNGAGKTTLLRLLAGLATPATGRIHWEVPRVLIGHALAMNESLRVAENLAYAAQLAGEAGERAALEAALERLGLAALAQRRFGSLSQGQKKRVSLARLFLAPPESAWLLDEPFVALDRASQAVLARLIEERLAAGGCVLLSSHQDVALGSPETIEVRL